MRAAFAKTLACTACQGDLTLQVDRGQGEVVEEGTLTCAACARSFPIKRGIPRFVPDDDYVGNFGWQWDRYARTQIDEFSGTHESEDRFRRETGWTPETMKGRLTLDAGCGAGRFCSIAARWGARVVAVDLAGPAAEACARNARDAGLEVEVVQASLFELPFRTGTFDRIYSLGVLQHTPDPQRAISYLPSLLKAGGEVAYWIYEYSWYQPFTPKYLLRPLTKRLPHRVNHAIAFGLVSALFPVTAVLSRLPGGRIALKGFPVADRHLWGRLSMKQQWEMSVLDTLDWYGPAYDEPQEEGRVLELLREAGLEDVRRLPSPGLAVAARRR